MLTGPRSRDQALTHSGGSADATKGGSAAVLRAQGQDTRPLLTAGWATEVMKADSLV